MSATDWIIDLVLIGLVLIQLFERRLSLIQVLLPVAIVVWAGTNYITTIPTDGNNLLLLVITVLIGAAIGAGVGAFTRVRVRDRVVVVKATALAAALWVIGMGSRLVFQIWATNSGGQSLGTFTVQNNLSTDVWAPALLFMAAATIIVRTVILLARVTATGRRENADASLIARR
ncbi:hypothetical protein [Kocuria sp. 2SI]|uniref:hypothetical protein n=1 Tax=Kocuria sp. 2SI TaxID=2502203 RepID=UPI0010F75E6F|nr:hypothetical protein [Kocuria sp. 2SI]